MSTSIHASVFVGMIPWNRLWTKYGFHSIFIQVLPKWHNVDNKSLRWKEQSKFSKNILPPAGGKTQVLLLSILIPY